MKKRILIWLTVLCLLFCAPAKADGPLDWLASWLFGSKQKQETAVPSHAETVEALRALGIRVPDETVQEAETDLEEMLTIMAQHGFSRGEQPWDFPLLLLDILGWGDYDYDTGEWTPTSNDVYAFDAEIFDIGWMYTLFLQGIAAIVPGFDCTEVTEEIDEWDEDEIVGSSPSVKAALAPAVSPRPIMASVRPTRPRGTVPSSGRNRSSPISSLSSPSAFTLTVRALFSPLWSLPANSCFATGV